MNAGYGKMCVFFQNVQDGFCPVRPLPSSTPSVLFQILTQTQAQQFLVVVFAGPDLDIGHFPGQPQSLDSQPHCTGPLPRTSLPLLGGRQNDLSCYLELNHQIAIAFAASVSLLLLMECRIRWLCIFHT